MGREHPPHKKRQSQTICGICQSAKGIGPLVTQSFLRCIQLLWEKYYKILGWQQGPIVSVPTRADLFKHHSLARRMILYFAGLQRSMGAIMWTYWLLLPCEVAATLGGFCWLCYVCKFIEPQKTQNTNLIGGFRKWGYLRYTPQIIHFNSIFI